MRHHIFGPEFFDTTSQTFTHFLEKTHLDTVAAATAVTTDAFSCEMQIVDVHRFDFSSSSSDYVPFFKFQFV